MDYGFTPGALALTPSEICSESLLEETDPSLPGGCSRWTTASPLGGFDVQGLCSYTKGIIDRLFRVTEITYEMMAMGVWPPSFIEPPTMLSNERCTLWAQTV